MVIDKVNEFLRLESAAGIVLLSAAVLAMLAVNSPADGLYDALLATIVEIRVGDFQLEKTPAAVD